MINQKLATRMSSITPTYLLSTEQAVLDKGYPAGERICKEVKVLTPLTVHRDGAAFRLAS
jgi:hypothetical protein